MDRARLPATSHSTEHGSNLKKLREDTGAEPPRNRPSHPSRPLTHSPVQARTVADQYIRWLQAVLVPADDCLAKQLEEGLGLPVGAIQVLEKEIRDVSKMKKHDLYELRTKKLQHQLALVDNPSTTEEDKEPSQKRQRHSELAKEPLAEEPLARTL